MASNTLLIRMLSAAAVLLFLGASAALAQTIVPEFVSGNTNITLRNNGGIFTGRSTVIALTSPGDLFELALIQDGFGTDTKFQYCWTEVHDTATGKNLTWRAPCNPEKVDECSLVLTSDGDFRLEVAADGSPAYAAFLSDTGGEGVVDVLLTDGGDLLLVTIDNTTVWQSSDHIQEQEKCREMFQPEASGSHRTSMGWFGLTSSISIWLLAIMVAFSS